MASTVEGSVNEGTTAWRIIHADVVDDPPAVEEVARLQIVPCAAATGVLEKHQCGEGRRRGEDGAGRRRSGVEEGGGGDEEEEEKGEGGNYG